MDLSALSLTELSDLQEQIKQEFKKRQKQEVVRAREQIIAIAQSVGVPLDELLGAGGGKVKTKTRKPVAVRYRHPDNSSLQWTGRGRQPQWVKDWLASGKSLDALGV
ncbi:DNA-binding protein [Oxalicibacterium flavum]|uniref:DNA-binding protein n=1 Tax=Oxalicibacterium flavum TaxID=179467 RepID=A0A8J2UKV0_9BURK|nr:H-NS histone family protein [Oxalicibacterium flavum]GGC08469.1 DNA-binding protein [Oxalicibacterium flavum]